MDNQRTSPRNQDPFDRLESILTEQIRLAQAGRFDEVASLAGDLRRQIAAASDRAADADGQKAAGIKRLYDRLCITLAMQKMDLSKTLAGLKNDNNLLRTYKKHTIY